MLNPLANTVKMCMENPWNLDLELEFETMFHLLMLAVRMFSLVCLWYSVYYLLGVDFYCILWLLTKKCKECFCSCYVPMYF